MTTLQLPSLSPQKELPSPELVFVYGSLLRGCHNHSLLKWEGATFLGNGVTKGDLYLVGDNPFSPFPGAKKGKGNLFGEVYSIPFLKELDNLECHPHLYKREKVKVYVMEKKKSFTPHQVECWVYFAQFKVNPRFKIISGKWKSFLWKKSQSSLFLKKGNI